MGGLSRIIGRVVGGWMVVTIFYITALGLVGIGGRWMGLKVPSWVELHFRWLVLWIAMGGAILATIQGRHIAINLSENILPPQYHTITRVFLMVLSSVLSLCFGLIAALFLWSESKAGTKIAGAGWGGDLPFAFIGWVLPLGFLLMGLLFATRGLKDEMESGP